MWVSLLPKLYATNGYGSMHWPVNRTVRTTIPGLWKSAESIEKHLFLKVCCGFGSEPQSLRLCEALPPEAQPHPPALPSTLAEARALSPGGPGGSALRGNGLDIGSKR